MNCTWGGESGTFKPRPSEEKKSPGTKTSFPEGSHGEKISGEKEQLMLKTFQDKSKREQKSLLSWDKGKEEQERGPQSFTLGGIAEGEKGVRNVENTSVARRSEEAWEKNWHIPESGVAKKEYGKGGGAKRRTAGKIGEADFVDQT